MSRPNRLSNKGKGFMDVKAKGLCGCQGQTDFLTRARGLWMSGQKDFVDDFKA